MILVDSNVLIDLTGGDQAWRTWEIDRLADLSGEDLRINVVILAEVAPHMGALNVFHREIAALDIEMLDIPDEAAFVAGAAFLSYRRNRGTAPAVMPRPWAPPSSPATRASTAAISPRVPLITPE